MAKRPTKKRRLVKGKDWHMWGIERPSGLMTKTYDTRDDAETWYPRSWVVKVKLVKVE